MNTVLLVCRLVLAAVFVLAAVGKLADQPGARRAAGEFGVPERLTGIAGMGLPLIELAVAAALVPPLSAPYAAAAATLLLLAFAAAMIRMMARGEQPDCHCFGAIHSKPVSGGALARDGVLAAVAAFTAVAGWSHGGGAGVTGSGLSGDQMLALVAILIVVAAIGGLTAFCLALLRQQGRILARLDAIENGRAGGGTAAAVGWPGLMPGATAPDVMLEDLDRRPVALSSLWNDGTPTLLVFADPGCGPCAALLPEVAAWQHDHGNRLTVAIVYSGTIDDQRARSEEHGLTRVLRQRSNEASRAYRVQGTPSAVLISADGRIAAEPAAGAVAIRALVDRAIDSPVVLPPRTGDPAPVAELADLDGRVHRLGAATGRATALLFWNPDCGFCRQMLPGLRTYEADARADAPDLLLISRGTVEANRGCGLRAPIVLDQENRVMRDYGARGTPVAILIDGSGTVVTDPAGGAEAVFALLREAEVRLV